MFKRAFLTLTVIAALVTSASADGLDLYEDADTIEHEVLKPYALSIGPKVGVNLSMAGNPEGMDIDMSGGAGFNVGLAANVRFGRPVGRPYGTERFGVQLEALYSQRTLANNVYNISMNCFEIPVLFQWYFLPSFAVEVGPTFTGAFSVSPKTFAYNNAIYQTEKIKANDVMLTIGVNCKLRNGFTADLRYNLGNSDLAGNFQTKVSTLSLGIGWLFSVIK